MSNDVLEGASGATGESTTPRPRRSTAGRRKRARRRQKRMALARLIGTIVGAIGFAGLLVYGATVLVANREPDEVVDDDEPVLVFEDRQTSALLATFDEADPSAGASLIVILAYDRATEDATAVFVPSRTVADIPGHGLLQVNQAYAFGEGPLLDATVDNLMGIDVDHTIGISEQGWASMFARTGGLTIDVPGRLVLSKPDGTQEMRFTAGEQFLDGPRIAEYMVFLERGEQELARLPRAQSVILGLLDQFANDPEALESVFGDGAPMLDTTTPVAELRELFELLALAYAEDELVVRTLPVSPIGSGEENSYRVDADRVAQLVEDRFEGSRPVEGQREGRTLQILNGNGTPGIGQKVAELLIPEGFRVVLTGNADDFDHAETRILIYSDSSEQLAIANEIKDLLGVGVVEVSRTPQSVVDITIVVGADFTP